MPDTPAETDAAATESDSEAADSVKIPIAASAEEKAATKAEPQTAAAPPAANDTPTGEEKVDRTYSAAYGVYYPLAEKGHAFAQFEMGLMYLHGHGVPENRDKAAAWFRKAAVQGHLEAKAELRKLAAAKTPVTKTETTKTASAPAQAKPAEPEPAPMKRGLPNAEAEHERKKAEESARQKQLAASKLRLPPPEDFQPPEPPTIVVSSRSVTLESDKPDSVEQTDLQKVEKPAADKSATEAQTPETDTAGTSGDSQPAPEKSAEDRPNPADKPIVLKQPDAAPAATPEPTPEPTPKPTEESPLLGSAVMLQPEKAIEEPNAGAQANGNALAQAPATEESKSGSFSKGLDAYKNGDFKTAYKYWQPMAESGDAESQTRLGYLYEHGKGVGQDYKKAVDWYRKAADQDEPAAQFNLGVMYRKGHGVEKNDKTARQWYERAAKQGHPTAIRVVDVMKAYKIGE
jgi:TPR repeat protein